MDDCWTRKTYIFLQLEQILIAFIMKKDFHHKKAKSLVNECEVHENHFEDNCSELFALDT